MRGRYNDGGIESIDRIDFETVVLLRNGQRVMREQSFYRRKNIFVQITREATLKRGLDANASSGPLTLLV